MSDILNLVYDCHSIPVLLIQIHQKKKKTRK